VTDFKLALISAGFEHGGNVTHRHLDGHSQLLVYPFESQLGNRDFTDFLSSVERVQYRYPEFPEGKTAAEIYELIIDEEMKTFLRKRNGSKFKDADLVLDESVRKQKFIDTVGTRHLSRKVAIEAFFVSTFAAWENYYAPVTKNSVYVGYSPAIGIDAPRIIRDFPEAKIIHVVRNPFSAYRDTKRRPFPQDIYKYLITWNIYHSTVQMFEKEFPQNVKIVRYEDLVADKQSFMVELARFIGVDFEEAMLYPSWNGVELSGDIAPWGTVLRSTPTYNMDIIAELSADEKATIAHATLPLARYFDYTSIPELAELYRVDKA
jgi:hypothetical protein